MNNLRHWLVIGCAVLDTCNHPVIEELGIEGNYVVRRCLRCGTIEHTLIKRNSIQRKITMDDYRRETKCPCCQSERIVSRSDGWKCLNCDAKWDLQAEGVDSEFPKTWLGIPLVCPEESEDASNKKDPA